MVVEKMKLYMWIALGIIGVEVRLFISISKFYRYNNYFRLMVFLLFIVTDDFIRINCEKFHTER